MFEIEENEIKMLSLLNEIYENSTEDFHRIYLQADPVVNCYDEYCRKTFDCECYEIHQDGKHFTSCTREIENQSKTTDIPRFVQQEFIF